MFSQISSWILLLSFLLPLVIAGNIIIKKIVNIDRFELLFPVGSIFGLTFFIFLLNIFSFIKPGPTAIIISYLGAIFTGFFIHQFRSKGQTISLPSDKGFLFYIISLTFWIVFIFWKGNHALIGSDTNLYWSVAHTFIKGNFPPLTPWQPDLSLQYHLGPFELLGAFYYFTNLSFEFLHIFFSCFFIFIISQIIIWIWKRHISWYSFIWANISALVILVSFGFLKIIIPIFPLKFPKVFNFHQFFLWIRNLPTVNQAIEVYGAPVNLDGLIYFIFHSYGLALFLSILVILMHSLKRSLLTKGLIIFFGLISLALMEGGFVTILVPKATQIEKSVLFFPSRSEINGDFTSYHNNQEISKKLPLNENWLPFQWLHVGVDFLLAISLVCLTLIKFTKEQKFLIIILFLSGIFSLLAYNFVVPKFLIANGNRFLAYSFIFLSLLIVLSFQNVIDSFFKKRIIGNIIFLLLIFFIILPTILPPLFLLSINRFGENKLNPKKEVKTPALEWIEKNLPYDTRIMVLDARAPHPSGQARAMVQAGVFAPVFSGDVRAYTIEASPEYFDIAYYLSPQALKKLKINTLLVENFYYSTLPVKRRQQLEDQKYFTLQFNSPKQNWEKIYKVNENYLEKGEEIDGTFEQLDIEIPKKGKIYIDNEENLSPSYLRRAIIFSLKDRDIYFLPESGVYLNVETNINFKPPLKDVNYDFLVLSTKTDPVTICNCRAKLIWKGIKDEVSVWQRE